MSIYLSIYLKTIIYKEKHIIKKALKIRAKIGGETGIRTLGTP